MVAFSLFCFVPFLTACRTTITSLRKTTSAEDDSLHNVVLSAIRQAVIDAGGESEWKASTESLSILLGDQAEDCLAEAFGWKAWAHASDSTKKYHRPTVPVPGGVDEALDWLRTGPLLLSDERLVTSIQKYPKTYLVAPHESYRKAMGTAPRKYREIFSDLLSEDPSVLQITYNCDGEGCRSECGSCWVSYGNRLSVRSSE
jgi:hypothetical protein